MDLKAWLRQSTTGTGAAALAASVGAVGFGAMSWQQALPLVVGGIVGLVWPENTGLQAAAEGTVSSVEKVVTAYSLGVQHAAGSLANPGSALQQSQPPQLPPTSKASV